MAVRIKFDDTYNVITPILILATRNGTKLGTIPANNIIFRDALNDYSEISFSVNKVNNGVEYAQWDSLKDFKLVWCRDWNIWFEIYVEVDETNELVKNVTGKSLAAAELSQTNLYDIEINTEDDIEQDDYVVTVLYDEDNPEGSLLNRIMDNIPHYTIAHVDASIANIQRTFDFDDISFYNALQEIAEEIDCLFVFGSGTDDDGNIERTISAYDLEAYCYECGYRGEFTGACPECGSENVTYGYGEDTSIYVCSENLADEITYSTDVDSVKNCFKLEAGDDLMTATIVNCNPNGSNRLYYISDETKEDMSDDLVAKIAAYDADYSYYYNEHEANIDSDILTAYNALVEKYSVYTDSYAPIENPIIGYAALMQAYYDTIDFDLYLTDSLMPSVETSGTSAELEAAQLNVKDLSPVAVSDVTKASGSTVSSAVLAVAKIVINYNYKVTVADYTYTADSTNKSYKWYGCFKLENYSDEEDTATTKYFTIEITDDYEIYVNQTVEKLLNGDEEDYNGIVSLFEKDLDSFTASIKEYGLVPLNSLHDACQSCIDILIEQGVATEDNSWGTGIYESLYLPYYNKLLALEDEIQVREAEIAVIEGTTDEEGEILTYGLQTMIDEERETIRSALNFQNYLGADLWKEFLAYRREDTYSNSNYISDGLNNAEIFANALEFISVAQKEIYKSATLQHSITATLKNLLVMKEFAPIVDYFEIGNWIRVRVDGELYRLRLIEYQIAFDDLPNIDITFSDVQNVSGGVSDLESILNQASSMASSYDGTERQASKGSNAYSMYDNWVQKGLDITNTKIISDSNYQNQSWDEHGMLFQKYDPETDDYEDTKLKIINSSIVITDDNFKSVKTAVGKYWYLSPTTGAVTMAYGVNAEVLVGKLILGEELGIYNTSGSLTFDTDGLTITNGINTFALNPNSEQLLTLLSGTEEIFYVDGSGNLMISGNITGGSINLGNGTFTVDSLGKLTATSGLIGDWNITHYNLYSQFSTQSVTYEQVAMTDEDGNYIYTTEYVYDENGNLVPETDEDGNVVYTTEYVYDENGNPVYETDADGNIVYETQYAYDDNGNIIYEYEYDEDGNVVYDDDGNPTYATDDDGNYIPQTQEVTVQQTQQVISYQTQEVISYETVEVTLDSYYDNYTSLNTSGTDSNIAISVGADEVDEDGIPVSSAGLIRLYNNGKFLTKSLYIEYDDADVEPAIFFRRYRSGATTQVKIHSGNNDDPFIAFSFWKDINTDTSGTYSVTIKSGGIAPYTSGTYYCGNSSKRWSQVYTKELNVNSSCALPCVVRMYDSDGHLRNVSRLYDDGGSNYGSNLLITGNGNTIIGGGEAPYNLYNAVYYGSDSEHLVLCSDNLIRFYVNCQTISDRKYAILNASLQFYPSTTNTGYLGTSSNRWGYLYAKNVYRVSESSLSDRKAKQNITELTEDYQDFIMGLQPVSFDFIEGDSHRKHLGFIAQDVRDTAMGTVGDLALFKASVVGHDDLSYNSKIPDEKLNWSLSYSEIIAPLVLLVQSQQKQIDAQQEQINTLLQYISDNSTE